MKLTKKIADFVLLRLVATVGAAVVVFVNLLELIGILKPIEQEEFDPSKVVPIDIEVLANEYYSGIPVKELAKKYKIPKFLIKDFLRCHGKL